MFCSQCGTKLPIEANFCFNCGVSVKSGLKPSNQGQEVCEIVFHYVPKLFGSKCYFTAEVIGKNRRVLAKTPELDHWTDSIDDKKEDIVDAGYFRKALSILIETLTNEGWNLMPESGRYWYSYRLIRNV